MQHLDARSVYIRNPTLCSDISPFKADIVTYFLMLNGEDINIIICEIIFIYYFIVH